MAIKEALVKEAPGLLGRIVSYINETSLYSQPQLALASGIACLAALKAHKVRSDTNLRTNFLIVGLASSGEGKGHGLKIVEKLLEATEHKFLISGRPASDIGLLKSLSKTGKKVILWDEFGLHLSAMTNRNAQSYKANILSILMDTFSAADGMYRGLEYADQDGKRPRIDIQEPCLNLYAVSTPNRFYESLNSAFVTDGFIPRTLLFVSDDKPQVAPLHSEYFNKLKINEDLTKEISKSFPVGALSHLAVDRQPTLVTFQKSNHAMAVMATMIKKYHGFKAKAQSEPEKAVYSRAVEHFIKLCLVAEELHNDHITGPVASWCAEVVDELVLETIKTLREHIFDSVFEKQTSKIKEVIKKSGGQISKSELCKRTQYLNPKEREIIVDSLIESEFLESILTDPPLTSKSRRQTQTFRVR